MRITPIGGDPRGRHRAGPGWSWWLWRAAPVGVLLAILPAPSLGVLPPPITVQVDGSVRLLPPGASVGDARTVLGLRPRSGDLLDVDGQILERRHFRGHISVDGVQVPDSTPVEDGDTIEVVHERDRFEPVTIKSNKIPGGQVQNPQTHLGTTPGEQVITSGSISGKLVSTVFRATGPSATPPRVALTFDDGPSATYTPRILQILKRFDAKATFFTVGYLVDRYPDLVKRMLRMGMSVANHSRNHPTSPPFADLPTGRMKEELQGGTNPLKRAGGEVKSFRPPGGSWSPKVVDMAEEMGQRVVLWSVDTQDWTRPKPGLIAQRVLQNARPGAIILLHDGGGDRSNTVKALPRILRGLKAMGLGFETL